MKAFILRGAVALAAVALVSSAAGAQPYDLVRRFVPGDQRTFEALTRSETQTQMGIHRRHAIADSKLVSEELVVEKPADKPGASVVIFESKTEQFILLEEDGRDLLSNVRPEARQRTLPPTLTVKTVDPKGGPAPAPEKIENPLAAVNVLSMRLGLLPAGPVKPGDVWTEEMDLGILNATVTTRFASQQTVNNKPCAVLESTVKSAFTGDLAGRVTIEKMTTELAEALDGSGPQRSKGTIAVRETTDQGEQLTTQTFETRLVRQERIPDEQLKKAQADVATLQDAMAKVQADELDQALQTLDGYIRANPQGAWTPAIIGFRHNVMIQRLLTKPLPATQLRAVVKDFQMQRDVAVAQGNAAEVARTTHAIRQLVQTNFDAFLQEADNPDPLVRELAAFALAFSPDAKASAKLLALASDRSAQVRGSAALALALQGTAVSKDLLVALLTDTEERARGAGAMLAVRSLKRGEEPVGAVLPLLVANLKVAMPWARVNTIAAIAQLAPREPKDAAAALVEAHNRETVEGLKPAYLQALREITGLAADRIEAYQEWLKPPAAPKG